MRLFIGINFESTSDTIGGYSKNTAGQHAQMEHHQRDNLHSPLSSSENSLSPGFRIQAPCRTVEVPRFGGVRPSRLST